LAWSFLGVGRAAIDRLDFNELALFFDRHNSREMVYLRELALEVESKGFEGFLGIDRAEISRLGKKIGCRKIWLL
jgi:hypothetical protein